MEKTEKNVRYIDGKLHKVDVRKKEVRIIDGKMKWVETINGHITKILGDRRNPYDKLINKLVEQNEQKLEHSNITVKEKDIYQSNIHQFYIKPKIKIADAKYRKSLLKIKVDSGILKDNVLKLKNASELLDDWARNKGYKDYNEYLNIIAMGRGFACYKEYCREWKYYPGMPDPIRENRRNMSFLGVYIAESSANKLFEGSQRMGHKNPGYDVICSKGYKIDVKAATLRARNTLTFHILKNRIADYFILIGFDNVVELNPLHILIIKKDEIIHGYPICELDTLTISNEPTYLEPFQKYERIDELIKLKEICSEFNSKHDVGINEYIPTKHEIVEAIRLLVLKKELEKRNIEKMLTPVYV